MENENQTIKDSNLPIITHNKQYTSQTKKVIKNNELSELRYKFENNIDRLNDLSTRNIAFEDSKLIINKYINDEKGIDILISILNNSSKKPNKKQGAIEYQILLIGYLASSNKEYLKLDMIKLLVKTLLSFTDQASFIIHKSLSLALCELMNSFLINNTDYHLLDKLFIQEFSNFSISQGKTNDKLSSSPMNNISICNTLVISDIINLIITHISNNKESSIYLENNLWIIYNNIENYIVKYNTRMLHPFIYLSFKLLLSYFTIHKILQNDKTKGNLEKIIKTANSILLITEANIYQTKIFICEMNNEILNQVKKFRNKVRSKTPTSSKTLETLLTLNNSNNLNQLFDNLSQHLNYCINNAAKDRVTKVQIAANETLTILNNIDYETPLESKVDSERLSKLHILRNISKNKKAKLTQNNTINLQTYNNTQNLPIKEIYTKGVSSYMTTKSFLTNHDSFKKQNSNSKKKLKGESSYDIASKNLRKFVKLKQNSKSKEKQSFMNLDEDGLSNVNLALKTSNINLTNFNNQGLAHKRNFSNNNNQSSSFSENDDAIYYKDIEKIKRYKKSKSNINKSSENSQEINNVNVFQVEDFEADQCEIPENNTLESEEKTIEIKEIVKKPSINGKQTIRDEINNLKDYLIIETDNFLKRVNNFDKKIDKKLSKLNTRILKTNDKILSIDINTKTMESSTVLCSDDLNMENPLIYKWINCLKLIQNEEINKAFELITNEMNDDLYLIRFIFILGKFKVQQLSVENSHILVTKLIKIIENNKISELSVEILSSMISKHSEELIGKDKVKSTFSTNFDTNANNLKLYLSGDFRNKIELKLNNSKKQTEKEEKSKTFSLKEEELTKLLDLLLEFSDREDSFGINSLKLYSEILSKLEGENNKK